MRRFRVTGFDFDTRATILLQVISPGWDENVRQLWEANQADVRAGLIREFGAHASDNKLRNFVDIGPRPFSIVSFHNRFAAQQRAAFVIGAYFPALTSACALGERILNQLMLSLREHYKETPEYKKVYRKDSFDNWQLPIDTLVGWSVLEPEAATAFRDLARVRNDTLHFRPETDANDRALAVEAIGLIDRIIVSQFPTMGLQPWFIPGTKGESFIKQSWETNPFVREIYLPNCRYVGPDHRIMQLIPTMVIEDRDDYPVRDVSDEEFLRMRETSVATGTAAPPAPASA